VFDLLSDDLRRDPFPMYARLRASAPVLRFPSPEMWLLLDHDSVKRGLTDHESFSSAVTPQTGKAPDWLVFTDPPRHALLRAIISKAFTPRSIAGLEPRIRELSRELLAPALSRGEIELVGEYASPLPTMVIAEMLGIPLSDRPQFIRWGDAIVGLSYAMSGGAVAEQKIAVHAAAKLEMQAYLSLLVELRRREPRDDLLSRLVAAEVDGERLDEHDLLGFFQLLLVGGTETTTNLIASAILCLHEHPDQLALLRAAPERLPAAIEEVLRFRSPGQIVFRETRREVALHGQTIPAGKFVLVVIGSANRDPQVFTEPDRFDITREPNPHLAFGHGIHFCLGAALSRLEARIALGDLLAGWKTFAPASREPWQPRQALHIHGPASLRIGFTT
jgi:cytochrome P450